MVRLGSIITQVRGVSYSPKDLHDSLNDESVILLRANNIQDGKINLDDVVFVDKKKVSTNQYLRRGDILICASSGSKDLVGKAAYFEENIVATFGAFCKVARPAILCTEFIGHFFNSPFYRKRISALSSGANINNIRNEHIDNLEIALPAEDVQKLITDKLNILSKIISLREQQLSKLDQLVKARFVEMFGDFPANPKGWKTGKIRDIVCEVRYGTSRPAVEGGKYYYLRMNNITYSGELDLTEIKQIDIPDNELEKCSVRYGDVLFNRTNSKELVGKTCVYDREESMVLAGFIIRIRVGDAILPDFLSAFLNTDFSKNMLLGMCKSAIGQANINAKELQDIRIYLPEIEIQHEFVKFKRQVVKLKSTVKQSLEKLETLKKSMMQECFG